MAELTDYSGPFDPQWSPEKLSREALLKLVKAYSEYIYRLDGSWYMTVKNRQETMKLLPATAMSGRRSSRPMS